MWSILCIINYLGKKIYECNFSQLFQSGISEANKYTKTNLFMASLCKAMPRASRRIKKGAGTLVLLLRVHLCIFVYVSAKRGE